MFSNLLVSGREAEKRDSVDAEGATSVLIIRSWFVDCKGEPGVSSGDAELEGIFEGKEIGDRKVKSDLVGRSKPGGVGGRKSSSGSKRTERQSSQGGNAECNWA